MPRLYQAGECSRHALELLTVHERLSTHDLAVKMRKAVNTARMTMAHLQANGHVWMVSAGSRTTNKTRPAVWALACYKGKEKR